MGKHKLRLSHMIPNAWFYRLQDMNTKPFPSANYSSSSSKQHNHPRNSICYTPTLRPFYTTNIIHSPPSPKHPLYTQPTESTRSSVDTPPSTSCSCRLITTASNTHDLQKLPPIVTKPTNSNMERSTMVDQKNVESCRKSSASIKIIKEDISKKETSGRKPVLEGIKIRSNSSKVCKRMVDDDSNDHKRENKLSSSCCIVKSSFDPQKDLKESMVEMILEDNIRESKDLEKLLACYLSLNSNEYHDMIVKAFEQILLSFNFGLQEI